MARGDVLRRAQQILDEREAEALVTMLIVAPPDDWDENAVRARAAHKQRRVWLRDVLNDLQLPGADNE